MLRETLPLLGADITLLLGVSDGDLGTNGHVFWPRKDKYSWPGTSTSCLTLVLYMRRPNSLSSSCTFSKTASLNCLVPLKMSSMVMAGGEDAGFAFDDALEKVIDMVVVLFMGGDERQAYLMRRLWADGEDDGETKGSFLMLWLECRSRRKDPGFLG
ncbi:hypothetical protein GOP47_0030984 [Adiantum capillus-veneris]|nr:hypothetical protein GOP47_0030984 [Adiantum capillus-veneris]